MKIVSVKDVTLVSSSIDRDVREILSAKLQIDAEQVAGVITLGELGFDSLALSDLAEAMEDKFGVHIPNRILPATLTLNQLVALLSGPHENAEDGLGAGVLREHELRAVELVGGYAFNRYFVENNGFSFSLSGFNRVDVANGPFATLQFDYRF